MPRKDILQPASLFQWYRLGLGVLALALGTIIIVRALVQEGSLPLLVLGVVFLIFGGLRLRAGWSLLGIRRAK